MNLKDKYLHYIKRVEANYIPLANFRCPKCHEVIKTLTSPKGEVWDSLCICPFCEQVFIKRITECRVEVCRINIH